MRRALLVFVVFVIAFELSANPDLEFLRKKVTAEMMQASVNSQNVKEIAGTIRKDGTWPGIDYVDVARTGFQHTEHLDNIVTLCRAYKKEGSEFKNDKKIKEVINLSLDYWLANDFICDNWWNNQIGTPDQFVRILLIMDKDLSEEQTKKSVAIAYRANLSASGARPSGDRIKIAGILAKNALFQRNDSLFDATIKVISGEIKFSTGRGMQYDYSFHHREDRVTSTLSYGMGYADAFAEWAALVKDTKYSFPESAINLLIDYYLDGICQTMVYGKYPDPGAENRSISRRGSLRPVGSSTPERLLKASDYRKAELEKIVKIRNNQIKPDLSGARFYWDSEYFSLQRPGFFTSVRMFSSRNNNMEVAYNGEGLKNHHYADGSNFISLTGDEYYDIYPVFDFQKIPGTTIVQKPSLPSDSEIQKKGLTEFVGAVTDGVYGAAVFDFKSLLDPLTAKKAWFFFDGEYVCLGTDINSSSDLNVATTLNQCLLRGEVVVMNDNKSETVSYGDRELKKVRWVLHDNVGYYFPDPISVNLQNQAATGTWFSINRQSESPKNQVTKDVFKLWIDHGKKPENDKYQYIVIPVTDRKAIESFADGNKIEIISNTSDLQAVRHSELGICHAVFYRAGSVQVAPGIKVSINSPGLVMVKTEGGKLQSVSVSDPTRRLSKINLTSSAKIEGSSDGFTFNWNEKEGVTEIIVQLPKNEYAGKSVTFEGTKDIVIDESAKVENVVQTISIDKVWAGHPVGFSLLTKGKRQYIAYYNSDRRMVVGQRNVSDKNFALHVLPLTNRETAGGTSTLLGWDSHNYVTLGIDKEGFIHLSGNMHVNPLTYFRSTKPDDISTLVQIMEMVGTNEKRCTYPNFLNTREGELIFHYRDGGSGDGNEIYNTYSCETKKWSRMLDTPLTDGQGLMNAYQSQPAILADNWYHVYWVWRDTPDCSTNHDLSYMKSPDLKNWFNAFGEPIRLPATLDNKSLIVDPVPVKGGIINLAAKLCLDENNKPVFVFHKYDSDGNLQFYISVINGKKWVTKQITEWDYRWEFSGNGSINNEVAINSFSRRSDGYYEVGYRHIKYGNGTLLLDKNLDNCGKVLKGRPLSEDLVRESTFPGLLIKTQGDSGKSGDPGVKYMLKWEAMPSNRDRAYPEPWPEPASLYLLKVSQK